MRQIDIEGLEKKKKPIKVINNIFMPPIRTAITMKPSNKIETRNNICSSNWFIAVDVSMEDQQQRSQISINFNYSLLQGSKPTLIHEIPSTIDEWSGHSLR